MRLLILGANRQRFPSVTIMNRLASVRMNTLEFTGGLLSWGHFMLFTNFLLFDYFHRKSSFIEEFRASKWAKGRSVCIEVNWLNRPRDMKVKNIQGQFLNTIVMSDMMKPSPPHSDRLFTSSLAHITPKDRDYWSIMEFPDWPMEDLLQKPVNDCLI